MNTIMNRFILMSALMLAFASCQKTPEKSGDGTGYLSVEDLAVTFDGTVDVKSGGEETGVEGYTVLIVDEDENEILRKTYAEMLSGGNIELLAGNYTLNVRSTEEEAPTVGFDCPVYGVSKDFRIEPGITTTVGELPCALLQCMVTISYSDEFITSLTGPAATAVTVIKGHSLEYSLSSEGVAEQRIGYFLVEGSTMEVVFSGNVGGKFQKMSKLFTGVAPKQWRKVHFVPKKNEQGNAVFDIVIDDLISDTPLNITAKVEESIIGEDPDAPKGDGGIALLPDYEGGCDQEISDLLDLRIVPFEERTMCIKFKAFVPSGVKKFTVDISTDNSGFAAAVEAAQATHLDLIHPLAANDIIFEVVPFPHGESLIGQTEIPFDLSAAQEAILNFKGRHTFLMTIVDSEGCRNEISVVMVVD